MRCISGTGAAHFLCTVLVPLAAAARVQAVRTRLSVEYLTDLTKADLLARASRLPAQSVVVFVTLFRDGAGRAFVPTLRSQPGAGTHLEVSVPSAAVQPDAVRAS